MQDSLVFGLSGAETAIVSVGAVAVVVFVGSGLVLWKATLPMLQQMSESLGAFVLIFRDLPASSRKRQEQARQA